MAPEDGRIVAKRGSVSEILIFLKTMKTVVFLLFFEGWDLPSGCQVAPRVTPWSPVALEIPFFSSSVSLMFFHQILGSDQGGPGTGNPKLGRYARAGKY